MSSREPSPHLPGRLGGPGGPWGAWISGSPPFGLLAGRPGRSYPIALAGEIDSENAAAVQRSLGRACGRAGAGDIVLLDLAELAFMDVAGGRALGAIGAKLALRDAALVTFDSRPPVRLVLEVVDPSVGRVVT